MRGRDIVKRVNRDCDLYVVFDDPDNPREYDIYEEFAEGMGSSTFASREICCWFYEDGICYVVPLIQLSRPLVL